MSNKNNPWDSNSNQEGRRKSADGFYKFNMNNVSKILPGGFGKNYLLLVLIIVIAAWLSSGFYVVQPNQEGVELRFGRYTMTSTPGLHYHLPLPIEKVFLVDVTTINHEEIGYRSGRVAEDLLPESLMLTGDENIVDINFEIQWHIKDARQYLFNLRDDRQGMTVQAAGESAMREVAGKNKIGYIIEGVGRAAIAKETQDILQKTLDEYQMGVQIVSVQMKKADPPARVIDSFRDVQTARADKERTINQAYAYKNEIIPKVRGEAEQILNEARAYQYQVVNQSVGDTERFLRLYEQYKQNKFVTKKRLYLETIEEVLGDKEKLIFTNKSIMPLMSVTDMLKTKSAR